MTGNAPLTMLLAESPFAYLSSLDNATEYANTAAPRLYVEAMVRPDLWQLAMEEELDIMHERGVFELVDKASVPKSKNVVRCSLHQQV